MLGVADLVKGVNQSALPVGLQRDVEFNHRPSGRVTMTLPVGWDGVPSVLDQHLIPNYGGHREVGE